MLVIMRLAWQEATGHRRSSSVIFRALTEQRRNRCSIRGSPPPAPRRQKEYRRRRPGMTGYTLAEIRRLLAKISPQHPPGPERTRLAMVPMAPKTPVPGPHLPLQATRLRTHI